MLTTINRAIEVDVPVASAYRQWAQFETLPSFMEDVESVQRIDDKHLHWKTRVGGVPEEWDAEITEQIPNKRIAWHAESGAANAGVVTFHRLSDERCRVMLQLGYKPDGLVEKIGSLLGVVGWRVEKDLQQFKDLMEKKEKDAADCQAMPYPGDLGDEAVRTSDDSAEAARSRSKKSRPSRTQR